MPELPVDVAVANRFISSLSKSLQALCHGCMDFDSGIEIVGYININIDSGSKVDYVLNEKVLKSTTNSMTFVSNSFLARKEPTKQTREGVCSPIPEISQQAQLYPGFESRGRSYLAGMHARNMSLASSQQFERKRSWPGMDRDWRANKRLRGGRIPHPSTQSRSFAPDSHSTPKPSFSSRNLDPSYTSAQSSVQASDAQSSEDQLDINIKKELYESNPDQEDKHEHDASQSCDPETCNGDQLSGFTQIKSDPDAETPAAKDETVTGSERLSSEANNDFKDTFLAPSTSEDNDATAGDQEHGPNVDLDEVTQDDADDAGQPNDYPPKRHLAPEQPSDDHTDLEESREEGNYSQAAYSDAGVEGSSDHFEVIEIDDEDEDVQAMFGETQGNKSQAWASGRDPALLLPATHNSAIRPAASPSVSWIPSTFRGKATMASSEHESDPFAPPISECQFCFTQFNSMSLLNRHITERHPELPTSFPFNCDKCHRGFFSQSGLRHHMESHLVKSECPECGHTFKYTRNLKRHLELNHQLKGCPQCKQYINGDQFQVHVLRCTPHH